MKIGELLFEVGFNADTMKLKDFGKAVSELNMSSILSAGSFGALYEGAKQLIDLTHTLGDNVNKFSIITGTSREELQRWAGVAKDVGSSGDMIQDSLTKIREQMDKVSHNQPMNLFFGRLGLRELLGTEKDPAVIYKKLLQNLKGLDDSTARSFLTGAGLSNQNLLLSKRNDLEKLYTDQVVQSDSELDKVASNLLLMNQTGDKIQNIFAQLGTSLLPGVNSALEAMNIKLKEMSDSRLLKDLLWFVEHVVMAQVKMLEVAGGGLEKIYRYGLPATDPDSAYNKGTVWGNPLYGISNLNHLGEEKSPIIQNNTINVNGNENPHETAKAVERAIKHTISTGITGGW